MSPCKSVNFIRKNKSVVIIPTQSNFIVCCCVEFMSARSQVIHFSHLNNFVKHTVYIVIMRYSIFGNCLVYTLTLFSSLPSNIL